MEPYRSSPDAAAVRLPQTDLLADRVLTLPSGAGVSADDVARIADTIRFIIREAPAIAAKLAAEAEVRV
jgi:dTDP-4-amino-4,6-dideoxygalactose transaminase